MPLTELQARVLRLLAVNRTEDSYLAGEAAILIEPNTTRNSRDLDYFHDSESRVAIAFDADRRLLEREGYDVEVDLNQPGYIRAIVTRAGGVAKIEWARDSPTASATQYDVISDHRPRDAGRRWQSAIAKAPPGCSGTGQHTLRST